ncbi:MAG: lipoyl(octanoyl) transferase LipB [Phycisphaerales bacterium JB039]
MTGAQLEIVDLGRLGYREAYAEQLRCHEQVLARRDDPAASAGVALLVEHDPVITITRRAAAQHLLASPAQLARAGVELVTTDRGGDVTYHGPGQLVVYPIVDLNRLHLRLHDYMRLLEQVVIDALAQWGIAGERDPSATGVWVAPGGGAPPAPPAKIAAMGVRIRRWVTLHGLALNIDPDMRHFQLIVPCGLAGRSVTSLRALLGERAPSMAEARAVMSRALRERLAAPGPRAAADR